MILKTLWRRKVRTLLTLVGVAVGVAAVVALSAIGEGMATGMASIMGGSGADITVGNRGSVMLLLSAVDEEMGDELEGIKGVAAVTGSIVGIVQMPDAPYFTVAGEDINGFSIKHYKVIAGAPLSGRRQVLLGRITARNFGKGLGDRFTLNDTGYRVVGIYETGVSMEDGGAVIGLSDAQRAFDKRHQVSYFGIKLSDVSQGAAVKAAIEAQWPDLMASRSGEVTQQSEALNLYRSLGLALGVFAVIIGGLGMMNTMLMNVLERTREIGVLRALGWRRRRVVGMILSEALVLSVLGAVVGIGAGIGLTKLAQLVPAVEPMMQGIFTPAIYLQAFVMALVLGVVGGFYPAWRASQLEPAEAMRYDAGAGDGGTGRMAALIARLGGGVLANLARRPGRTLFTVLGVAIGVGFIVGLSAISYGFESTMRAMFSAGEMDLVAQQSNAAAMSLSEIDENIVLRMRARPDVAAVSRTLIGVSSTAGLPYFIIFGLDVHEGYILHYRLREGRFMQRAGEIVLGRFAANNLDKRVGDKLRLSGLSYEVVGIYENGISYEDAGGLMSLRDAQELLGKPGKVSMLGIKLEAAADPDVVAAALELAYANLLVTRSATFTEHLQDLKAVQALLGVVLVLALAVGGIVMTNAMLMSVFERTQEIGVLRALGWARWRVLWMILQEALAISMLSGVLGIVFGVGLAALIKSEPTMGALLAPRFPPELFGQVLVLTVVLGMLGGVYPAWRAASLPPIEALRYE